MVSPKSSGAKHKIAEGKHWRQCLSVSNTELLEPLKKRERWLEMLRRDARVIRGGKWTLLEEDGTFI
jgi:hypothetical protein